MILLYVSVNTTQFDIYCQQAAIDTKKDDCGKKKHMSIPVILSKDVTANLHKIKTFVNQEVISSTSHVEYVDIVLYIKRNVLNVSL